MPPHVQRALSQGALAAFILAALGAMMAYVASTLVADPAPVPRGAEVRPDPAKGADGDDKKDAVVATPRPAPAESEDGTDLLTRVPLTLAAIGFVLVTLTELALNSVREKKKIVAAMTAPVVPGSPEHTAQLLAEILKQEEARAAAGKPPEGASPGAGTPPAEKPPEGPPANPT